MDCFACNGLRLSLPINELPKKKVLLKLQPYFDLHSSVSRIFFLYSLVGEDD